MAKLNEEKGWCRFSASYYFTRLVRVLNNAKFEFPGSRESAALRQAEIEIELAQLHDTIHRLEKENAKLIEENHQLREQLASPPGCGSECQEG